MRLPFRLVLCDAMPKDQVLIVGDPGERTRIIDPQGNERIVTTRKPSGILLTGLRGQVHVIDPKDGAKMEDRPDLPGLRATDAPLRNHRNPATCGHRTKRLLLGSIVWRCADCGVRL